jgi:hypothetical protein
VPKCRAVARDGKSKGVSANESRRKTRLPLIFVKTVLRSFDDGIEQAKHIALSEGFQFWRLTGTTLCYTGEL